MRDINNKPKTDLTHTNRNQVTQLKVKDSTNFFKAEGYRNLIRNGFYCSRANII